MLVETYRNCNSVSVAGLHLDVVRSKLAFGDRRTHVAPAVLRLMRHFVDAGGRALTKADLVAFMWPGREYSEPLRRNLEVHISNLRAALRHIKAPITIGSSQRVGYRLDIA